MQVAEVLSIILVLYYQLSYITNGETRAKEESYLGEFEEASPDLIHFCFQSVAI